MENQETRKAVAFLETLLNQPLCYGVKSPDLDLYELGFGRPTLIANLPKESRKVCSYVLHITCRFKIIQKTGGNSVDTYYEDTSQERFHSEIRRLIGLVVKRIALSEKNDLWLDFGDYWMVFATVENGEESWRFFMPNKDIPHLVVSNSWIEF